ncbi:glutaminase A [Sulfurovum sp. NBC37-1]|uniref:glutaminase A n=1 Tax=Sulfurovum sp. (strain NBC37-1) TaxID=387093 RepID=UPI0001587638|nr:glutaminase A [Sulfurovum sp. NBC37-1]BAF71859.1 glutaminase [Sulfurovum sp. NBC37-1]
MKIESRHFVKKGVMRLSIACASFIMLGTSPVQAKGPVPSAVQTEVKKTSLTQERINAVLKEAYEKFKNDQGGKNADYIKALAEVDSKIFGITLVTPDGKVYEIGDTKAEVSIQSVSKVFTACKVLQEKGDKFLQEKIGVNATGLAFNSIIAIELHDGSASNPFVNAGAIQATSWVEAKDSKERWFKIKQNMNDFAGRKLPFKEDVYQSEVNDNKRNQAISKLLDAYGRMGSDPLEATTVYTKQCSVGISSHDLGVMAATLANHGINPKTGKRVLDREHVQKILAVMATAGLYDNAGDWLYLTGTPAKSGVGGGILAVVPGKMGIGVVSPPLDKYGNSVRGQKAAAYIIDKLGINPLAQ